MNNRITAIFPSQSQAEAAVSELRTLGVHESDLSFIARHSDNEVTTERVDHHDDGKGAARGLAVGASAGALFGLAAALIPGVGPFITAGFLATSLGAAAGGAAAGAIVGGVTGTIAGALADAGYDRAEAEYYESRLNEGGVLVAIEPPAHVSSQQVVDVVERNGGTVRGWNANGTEGRASLSTATGNFDGETTRGTSDYGAYSTSAESDRRLLEHDRGTQNFSDRTVSDTDLDEAARLRLHEERLEVEKERYRAGTVEVGKRVETRTENVNVELEREEVVIERHPVTGERPVEGNVQLGSDRETIRVDLEAERADVEKRAYVTEEVEVGKRTETERQTFTEQVGKEVLEVNKTGEVDVRADQTATGSLRDSTRDLEDDLGRKDTSLTDTERLNEDGTRRR
ncbi:YsnF/AvaK domain-containing protein [Deinococcus cellulosilyticus]|uniref:DUF2382 domain-containing protein n=1 Tax=Deinococcus cellulosilyticus (strain DSM 18568 / NBRC 106333 / KACC 11606 / 5516J-15) TaxID=1223518 RepID=A0A511N1M4_DEIC1|nr:YsnF/AvaK domain-containing protein [Deinococcus cellulosilyticus]GEM46341.1 hypothetical protein DC3_19760 [Deinococcus cellulosilyticus NBRC 106333 = KACC 11606]